MGRGLAAPEIIAGTANTVSMYNSPTPARQEFETSILDAPRSTFLI